MIKQQLLRDAMIAAIWAELERQAGSLIFAVDKERGTCSVDETLDVAGLADAALQAAGLAAPGLSFGPMRAGDREGFYAWPILRRGEEVAVFSSRPDATDFDHRGSLSETIAGGLTIQGATIKGIVRKNDAIRLASQYLNAIDPDRDPVVALAAARLRITGLEETLRPFAEAEVLGTRSYSASSEPGRSFEVRTREDLGRAFDQARRFLNGCPIALGFAVHMGFDAARDAMRERMGDIIARAERARFPNEHSAVGRSAVELIREMMGQR